MIYHDFSWLTLKNTMFGAGVLLIIAQAVLRRGERTSRA